MKIQTNFDHEFKTNELASVEGPNSARSLSARIASAKTPFRTTPFHSQLTPMHISASNISPKPKTSKRDSFFSYRKKSAQLEPLELNSYDYTNSDPIKAERIKYYASELFSTLNVNFSNLENKKISIFNCIHVKQKQDDENILSEEIKHKLQEIALKHGLSEIDNDLNAETFSDVECEQVKPRNQFDLKKSISGNKLSERGTKIVMKRNWSGLFERRRSRTRAQSVEVLASTDSFIIESTTALPLIKRRQSTKSFLSWTSSMIISGQLTNCNEPQMKDILRKSNIPLPPIFNRKCEIDVKCVKSFALYYGDLPSLPEIYEMQAREKELDLLIVPIGRVVFGDLTDDPSPSEIKYQEEEALFKRQLSFLKVERVLAAISLNDSVKRFKQKVTSILPGGFSKYFIKRLERLFGRVASNLEGLLLSNLDSIVREIGKSEIIKCIQLIRQGWPKIMLLLDEGYFLLEDVRDYVNGITVKNLFISPEGHLQARFGEEKAKTDAKIKRLNFEISIRNDFLVLDIEPVRNQTSSSVTRQYLKNLQTSKFVGWVTTSEQFLNVDDVRPMQYTTVSDDSIFEICTHPVLLNWKNMVERVYRTISLFDIQYEVNESQQTFKNCNFPKKIVNLLSGLSDISKDDVKNVLYAKILPPEVPEIKKISAQLQTFMKDAGIIISEAKNIDIGNDEIVGHEINNLVSMTTFGLNFAGEDRKAEVERRILAVMEKMRSKNLLASLRFADGKINGNLQSPTTAVFNSYLQCLRNILRHPSNCVQYIFDIIGEDVAPALEDLISRLEQNNIQIWSAAKGSFLLKNEDANYTSVWGIAGREMEDWHFYISDNHPNFLEVIVFLYFKAILRYPTDICILYESLIQGQDNSNTEVLKLPIPLRFEYQILNSSVSEKLTIMKNTHWVIYNINIKSDLSMPQKHFLQGLSLYIHQLCNYYVHDYYSHKDKMKYLASQHYEPTNEFERSMVKFVGWSTLDPKGLDYMLIFARKLHRELTINTNSGEDIKKILTLCYLQMTFWKACRRVGWSELEVSLLGKNALFLPESDQSAVTLEMSTTQSNMNNLFDLTSLELSIPMHNKMRQWAADFEPKSKDFTIEAAVDTEKGESPHLIVNAFLFVYPILLDLLLINFLGSGLFYSDKMMDSTQSTLSMMFLFMFPVIGGIMNSIGRSCTYYFFQKSLPLMISSFARRLSGGILITLFCASALAIAAGIQYDIIHSVLVFFYSLIFMLFMVLLTIMVTFRDIDDFFFNSRGPRTVFQSLIPPILVAFLARFAIPVGNHNLNIVLWLCYIVSISFSVTWMCMAFAGIATEYLEWPDKIIVTPKKEILELFSQSHKKPDKVENEEQTFYDRRVRLWERCAREHFMEKLEGAINLKKRACEKAVQKRIQQFRWERLLMSWYSMRTSVELPVRFSAEWDSLLTQAVGELKKKYQTEKANRGDLLFELEIPAVLFGFMYFTIIFLDKWAIFFVSGKTTYYLSSFLAGSYTTGTIWATIFMLVASGFLEICLGHVFMHRSLLPPPRLGESGSELLLNANHKSARSVYIRELCFFLRSILVVWLIIAGIVIGVYFKNFKTYAVFALASLGYFGLLLALFHKIFLKVSENYLNIALGTIIVFSTSTSALLIWVTRAFEYALFANVASGVLFAVLSVGLHMNEDRSSLHYRVILSPSVTSSGQKHIGSIAKSVSEKAITECRNQLIMRLDRDSQRIEPLLHNSVLGSLVSDKLQKASQKLESLPPGHLILTALPDASRLLIDLNERFNIGRTVVYLMPEKYFVSSLFKPAAGINGWTGYCSTRKGEYDKNMIVRYTALGKSDPKNFQDQTVFISIPNKSIVDTTQYICESLIHEYLELGGISHQISCISEFLFIDSVVKMCEAPSRIIHQLKTANEDEIVRILCATNEEVISQACLGIDVDKYWETFSPNSRSFLIHLVENWDWFGEAALQLRDIGNIYQTLLPEFPQEIESHIRKNSKSLDSKTSTLAEIIACRILLTRFALLSASTCRSVLFNFIKVPNIVSRPLEMNNIDIAGANPGFLMQIFVAFWMSLNHLCLTNFLALVGDSRLGREVSAGEYNIAFRTYFFIVHFLSRIMVSGFQETLIYSKRPEVKSFLDRVHQGLFRIHRLTKTILSSHIIRIDSLNSATETIISILESTTTESTDVLKYARYCGPKLETWKPDEKERPISRAYFSSKFSRLLYEFKYDGSGKVVSTSIFEYENEYVLFPTRHFVLEGEILLPNMLTLETHQALKEIHYYKASIRGLVSSSLLLKPNPSKKSKLTLILASYNYNPSTTLDNPIFDTITYECNPDKIEIQSFGMSHKILNSPLLLNLFDTNEIKQAKPNWKLTLHVAQGWAHDGSKMKFKSAEFISSDSLTNKGAPFYRAEFDYSHPQHTRINCFVIYGDRNNHAVPTFTPAEISDDSWGLLKAEPPRSFYVVNELLTHGLVTKFSPKSLLPSIFNPRREIKYNASAYSTFRARQELWTMWRTGKIAGCFARDLDEVFLRNNSALVKYWRYRDFGLKDKACDELTVNKDTLDVVLVVADRPTTRSHLHIRFSDLYMLGCGGDAPEISSQILTSSISPESLGKNEAQELLQVLNLDSGTWPTGGGGVGSCRRDLIDHLSRVRWTAIAEIGGAELVQKDYQIERNVTSIIYLPLWDVDFGSPSENVYRTEDYKTLHYKALNTTNVVVRDLFVPLVQKLILGCMLDDLPIQSLAEYVRVFVDLHAYFESYDWVTSWNHPSTQDAWVTTWMDASLKAHASGVHLNIETPTLEEIDMLFSLLTRLLLVLTVKLPNVPVAHVSHHGVQAILGVLVKFHFGSSLIIWDHGILWRERLFGLCEQDGMPRFVQIGFIGLTRLITRLAYAWADHLTPCTSIQNVSWEQWLSGGKYRNDKETQASYKKISPILNGMDVTKFTIRSDLELEEPTAVMLSHISPVKDIRNAILSAHFIVNEFKFTKYKLHIYGSPEKDPGYTNECVNLITALNLSENVILKGLGNPSNVLPSGWIFINSSITEGLPLALGEAGLCGLPVVCTDVGGSREVISDLKAGICYGMIVPPQKPKQLGLAQLKVMAMSDGLEQLVDPSSTLVLLDELISDPGMMYKRITDPLIKDKRRKLGVLLRARIIDIFNISRYWREHEQILWWGVLHDHASHTRNV